MALVEIKCPRCGSGCAKTQNSEEFLCSHCRSVFKFCDPTKQVVATGALIRNCQYCGKPIEGAKGFKCTKCGREHFCESCVDSVRGKYYCFQCIKTMGKTCSFCSRYAEYVCIQCGEKACVKHPKASHFITCEEIEKGTVLHCYACKGDVCWNCAKKSFLGTIKCPKCSAELHRCFPIGVRS